MPLFIVQCTSGKEPWARIMLNCLGYPHSFVPTKKVDARSRKKGKPKSAKRYRWEPVVPGWVIVEAATINCEKVASLGHKSWMKVLVVEKNDDQGNTFIAPYQIPQSQALKMKELPMTLERIKDELDEREAEERAAKRPVVGQLATVLSGPLAGSQINVDAIEGGKARADTPVGRMELDLDNLERVA